MVHIRILDEIEVKPGMAAKARAAYRARYVPAAQKRGMVLEGAWQHPPLQDFDVPTTLYFLWSVEDVSGWWAQRMSRLADGRDERFAKLAFWQELAPMTLSRRRRMLSDQPEEG